MKATPHWTVWVALALLGVALWELSKIHRHLHFLECHVAGYVTDTDGRKWPDSDAECAKLEDTHVDHE